MNEQTDERLLLIITHSNHSFNVSVYYTSSVNFHINPQSNTILGTSSRHLVFHGNGNSPSGTYQLQTYILHSMVMEAHHHRCQIRQHQLFTF